VTIIDDSRDTARDMPRDTLSDEEARVAARAEWHASGGTLTGKQLAERYKRSAKWGQNQRAAAEREAADRAAGSPSPTVPRHNTPAAAPVPRTAAPTPTAVPRAAPPSAPSRAPLPAPASPAKEQPVPRQGSGAVQWITAAAVAAVAVVAAAASYSHMHDLAVQAGEGEMARVLPLSVDGLVVAATMTLLSARRSGRRAGALPWAALFLGLGASLAANVAAAEPTVVGRLVAAWPPVALALSFELLLRQTRASE